MDSRTQEFAGALTQRITWQRAQDQPDGIGGVTRTWQTQGRLWADVTLKTADASVVTGRTVARARIVVRCRAGAGVGVGDRLIWRGRTHLVVQVAADPDIRAQMNLIAEQVTP